MLRYIKLFFLSLIVGLGSIPAAFSETGIVSYIYLPRAISVEVLEGDAAINLNHDSSSVDVFIDNNARTNTFDFSDSHLYTPLFDENHRSSLSDDHHWISYYSYSSPIRNYTLFLSNPRALPSHNWVYANGSNEIKKQMTYDVSGSGRVRITIPFITRTYQISSTPALSHGSNQYINYINAMIMDSDNQMLDDKYYQVRVSHMINTNHDVEIQYHKDSNILNPEEDFNAVIPGSVVTFSDRRELVLEAYVDSPFKLDLTINTLGRISEKLDQK